MMRLCQPVWISIVWLLVWISPLLSMFACAQSNSAQTGNVDNLAGQLTRLSDWIATSPDRPALASQLPEAISRLRQRGNQSSSKDWSTIRTLEDWQRFRDDKLERLRRSLGQPPQPTVSLKIEVKRRYEDPAGRFVIENVVYESRSNVWVTANLYRPTKAVTGAPGIVISHAHHTPKEHAELQAMGMTWSRAGCYVLVPDHFGHGERRQHPFVTADSFPGSFRVSRQDYYFRYDSGIKLHLLGESLMGWLAWDLSRAVDCLLQQPGIDPAKIILLGSVAGGGDPCAVAAALDSRVAAAVPFNFGGPQPETSYPLPEDAETSFNYAGGGSWESTRNLTNSISDGFLPWVITSSVAPRRLIYGHEFRWDQTRDPVWRRLQTIYQLAQKPEHIDFAHGHGELRGQPPEASHCTHIGAVHRQRIHEAFRRWFEIQVSPEDEILEPLPVETLHCLQANHSQDSRPMLVDFAAMAKERVAETRIVLARQPIAMRRQQLRELWGQVLGPATTLDASPAPNVSKIAVPTEVASNAGSSSVRIESLRLSNPEGLQIPLVLLLPSNKDGAKKWPVVLYVHTSGHAQQLKDRSHDVARLLEAGHAVCIPDVRGTGLGAMGSGRGRSSAATSISSSLLMLGDPLVSGQLRDLRSVCAWLRERPDIDSQKIKVWGDARRPTVQPDADRVVPRDDDAKLPPTAEPAACLLALLLSLTEDSVNRLCLSGGLSNFGSCLEPHQVRLPHDCVLPGIFRAGDLEELVVQAAERMPVRCENLVDGGNREMSSAAVAEAQTRMQSLCPNAASLKLTVSQEAKSIEWLLEPTAYSDSSR